ncbi:MAG TPA: glutamate racemase [Candidatus Bathyarchaeia archaeon]|nr:glutamate racemase [Candidatus Bathyarchaeia archaeon]
MDKRPLGVFDSGVGGLTVVKEIIRVLPSEKIVYIGDTARVPWGTRGKKTVINFSQQLTRFLLQKKVKIVIVACHTASSLALPLLKRKTKTPVLGVIDPSVKEAISKSKTGRIGLIGTPATVKASAWGKALRREDPQVKVFAIPCPMLVPLVEEGLVNHQATRIFTSEYLGPLKKKRIDTLILGCTHYSLLQETIKKVMGDVFFVNPGKTTATALKKFLIKHKIQGNQQKPIHELYFTDLSYRALDDWKNFSGNLGHVRIKEVDLDNL